MEIRESLKIIYDTTIRNFFFSDGIPAESLSPPVSYSESFLDAVTIEEVQSSVKQSVVCMVKHFPSLIE